MATTTKIEKMTYSKALAIAIAQVADSEVADKLTQLKASIEKKNGAERKPTKNQVANDGIKADIVAGLDGHDPLTIGEMIKTIPALAEMSSQKVSALVRQMVEAGEVVRTEDKRKAYFSIPSDED